LLLRSWSQRRFTGFVPAHASGKRSKTLADETDTSSAAFRGQFNPMPDAAARMLPLGPQRFAKVGRCADLPQWRGMDSRLDSTPGPD